MRHSRYTLRWQVPCMGICDPVRHGENLIYSTLGPERFALVRLRSPDLESRAKDDSNSLERKRCRPIHQGHAVLRLLTFGSKI